MMRINKTDAAKRYKNHAAKILLETKASDGSSVIIIQWRNPSAFEGHMRFIINSNRLYVSGDYGEGIYAWSSYIDLPFLAGLDYYYFVGKCQASAHGRQAEDWDPEKAERWIKSDLKHMASDRESYHKISGVSSNKIYRKHLDDMLSACYNARDWESFLTENREPKDIEILFGGDEYSYANIGKGHSLESELHWYGIKAAIKSLKIKPADTEPSERSHEKEPQGNRKGKAEAGLASDKQ